MYAATQWKNLKDREVLKAQMLLRAHSTCTLNLVFKSLFLCLSFCTDVNFIGFSVFLIYKFTIYLAFRRYRHTIHVMLFKNPK